MKGMMPNLPLNDRIKTAAQLLRRARIFFDIWWLYEGQATRSGILDAMNEYPDYFLFDSHAQFVSHVVHMAMLYEGRKDTTNLRLLKREISPKLDATTMGKLDQLFIKINATEKKVRILRNNLFAHRSARITYNDVFGMVRITPDQLRDLTNETKEIVDIFLEAVGHSKLEFHTYPTNQLKKLLNDIKYMQIQNGDL